MLSESVDEDSVSFEIFLLNTWSFQIPRQGVWREEKMEPRIIWMMDESISNCDPKHWGQMKSMYAELIDILGKDGFNHHIADPVPAFGQLTDQMESKKYSAIVDLTGWSSAFLAAKFPGSEIISDFGMTRVRDVSTPDLKTTGHLLKTPAGRMQEIQGMDLSDVLIFDDTSISGGTGLKTIDELAIEGDTTHAYLIANTGDWPVDGGAPKRLEDLGHEVNYGSEVKFGPIGGEDGWHLQDLHEIGNLKDVFPKAMELQRLYLDEQKNYGKIKDFLTSPENVNLLFPRSFDATTIEFMVRQGSFRLTESLPEAGTVHVANPTLWASKYLMDHMDREKVLANEDKIVRKLEELNTLTVGYQRVKGQVDSALARIGSGLR